MRVGLIVLLSPIIGGVFLMSLYHYLWLCSSNPERYYQTCFLIGYLEGLLFSIWCGWVGRSRKLSPAKRILAGSCFWAGLFVILCLCGYLVLGTELFAFPNAPSTSFIAFSLVCYWMLPGPLTGV